MSTTFEVYPGTASIPTFREILELAAQRLNDYLADYEIAQRPVLSVSLHSRNPNKIHPTQLDQPALWPEDWYAWFQALPNKGGTDAHFRTIDPFAKEIWETFIEEMGQDHPLQSHVAHCISHGYYWFFRRSAGQSATINVTYGMLAAAVAELTDGFIFSDDSAWDYPRFPARAADFYTWYFRPEHAIDPECRDWAARCLARIPSELILNDRMADYTQSIDSVDLLLQTHGARLRTLIGQTIDEIWCAWNTEDNSWFADEAVLIKAGEQSLAIAFWKLSDTMLGWNAIDTRSKPGWVSNWDDRFSLEWRQSALPAAQQAIGAQIQAITIIEYQYQTTSIDNPQNPERSGTSSVWLLHGIEFTHTQGIFTVFNALDKNGITAEQLAGANFRHTDL